MLQTRCVKIRLRPGSLPRVREWARELTMRADETLATMRAEGVLIENVFLDSTPQGDFLLYYMKAESLDRAAAVARQSAHAIDAYHQAFKRDTWESREPLELLLDLDRLNE